MLYRFLRNDAWLSLPQIGSVLVCILELCTNTIYELSLENTWLHPIFFLHFNNTC